MEEQETREKILQKIDIAVNSIEGNHNVDFIERISRVVCNLAAAYDSLGGNK